MKKRSRPVQNDAARSSILSSFKSFSEGQITLWNLKTLSVPWFHVFFVAVEIKRTWFLEHTSPLKRGDE